MRTTCSLAALIGLLPLAAVPDSSNAVEVPAPRPIDARFAPYAPDPDHPWNQLHRALFVREAVTGGRRVHTTDPLLYRGGSFLLVGDAHRRAVALLDQFVADRSVDDPLKRLILQRDLWAAFDYAAWYPDDWVLKSQFEPGAVALRNRLSRAIGRLALDTRELAAVPDNYALAVKANQYPAAHDPEHPDRPFLPPDLFDPAGPWVRFHETTYVPMTERHFAGAGGRAAHVVFLRLPGGRAATEQYLDGLSRDAVEQFPPGTMTAMVRRAFAVDAAAKVRATPVTELVQIRVYRRIPTLVGPSEQHRPTAGEQDVYEFVLDRSALFAGRSGLRAVGPEERAEPFARGEGGDPFEVAPRRHLAKEPEEPQMKTCIGCHAAPGVHSMLSMQRGLKGPDRPAFKTYSWDVEMKYTAHAKVARFDWGLLQGKLEAE